MTTRLSRFAALERSRRAEAEQLCSWFESRVTSDGANLDDLDRASAICLELFSRDPELEARLAQAYCTLGWLSIGDDGALLTAAEESKP